MLVRLCISQESFNYRNQVDLYLKYFLIKLKKNKQQLAFEPIDFGIKKVFATKKEWHQTENLVPEDVLFLFGAMLLVTEKLCRQNCMFVWMFFCAWNVCGIRNNEAHLLCGSYSQQAKVPSSCFAAFLKASNSHCVS